MNMKAWLLSEMYQWQVDKYVNKPMKVNGLTVWVS
jgi:hypothetical protein